MNLVAKKKTTKIQAVHVQISHLKRNGTGKRKGNSNVHILPKKFCQFNLHFQVHPVPYNIVQCSRGQEFQFHKHEFHETCHSVTIYFMIMDSKRCCETTTSESIHTKDESKRGSAFVFIFGVN